MNISWITKIFWDVASSFQAFWGAGTGGGVYGKNISKKRTSSKEERTALWKTKKVSHKNIKYWSHLLSKNASEMYFLSFYYPGQNIWTERENFDICFRLFFNSYCQSFICGKETGYQDMSSPKF